MWFAPYIIYDIDEADGKDFILLEVFEARTLEDYFAVCLPGLINFVIWRVELPIVLEHSLMQTRETSVWWSQCVQRGILETISVLLQLSSVIY